MTALRRKAAQLPAPGGELTFAFWSRNEGHDGPAYPDVRILTPADVFADG